MLATHHHGCDKCLQAHCCFAHHARIASIASVCYCVALPTMKLLNDPRNAVTEMLQGLVSSAGHLNRLDGFPEVRSCHKITRCV